MGFPTTVVGMLVVSALPKKVVGVRYVNFSIKYKNVKVFILWMVPLNHTNALSWIGFFSDYPEYH